MPETGDISPGVIAEAGRCLRLSMVVISTVVVLTGIELPAEARASPVAPVPFPVSCSTSIGTQEPRTAGYRVVLGMVSVPPAYNAQVVPVGGHEAWTYWRKAGMAVRAGGVAVTVSVPTAWRTRAAITWGNSPIVETLRFGGCGNGPRTNSWNGYAGGFYLSTSRACVPLVFAAGHRRVVVRFGIGTHCT
jgi:hypothetical protein